HALERQLAESLRRVSRLYFKPLNVTHRVLLFYNEDVPLSRDERAALAEALLPEHAGALELVPLDVARMRADFVHEFGYVPRFVRCTASASPLAGSSQLFDERYVLMNVFRVYELWRELERLEVERALLVDADIFLIEALR